ncbi:expansin EXLX1 family cellulose-binding protein [Plantactinospora soyae]|uniref:Expansin (Peptidoglycan-binding protein) n=1 Tax=Plantactinospora soyae TaxID=1544732 RepID=A0A927M4C1_9ACTN|nr:expansin EXLX1 family cellulose-binding protein [Plantactinospora soyae]MBE1487474.1 expansin (peptidoglycan-binding protein) [Plantactinospora soyae]
MTDAEPSDQPEKTPAAGVVPDGPDADRSGGSGSGRRRPKRWLAGGFAVVVAALLGLVLVWQFSEPAACAAGLAAPPAGPKVYKGKASHYDGGNSGGNCSLPGPPANRLYAALGSAQYSGSAACGSFLDVTGPKGTVRVMVLDRCAGCTGGKIDLSKQAFAKIADLSKGITSITYRAVVNPPSPGPLTFRMKSGTSQYWFAVQVGNHGNPVKSVAAKRAGSSWRAAKRGSDNYWVIDGGMGPGPYSIRVVDVYGNEAVATGITMSPRRIQRSKVPMYGSTPAGGPTPTPTPSVAASASASPTVTPPSPAGSAEPETIAGAAGGPAPVRVGCG